MFSFALKPSPRLKTYNLDLSGEEDKKLSKMQQMTWRAVSLKPTVMNKMYVSHTFWLQQPLPCQEPSWRHSEMESSLPSFMPQCDETILSIHSTRVAASEFEWSAALTHNGHPDKHSRRPFRRELADRFCAAHSQQGEEGNEKPAGNRARQAGACSPFPSFLVRAPLVLHCREGWKSGHKGKGGWFWSLCLGAAQF